MHLVREFTVIDDFYVGHEGRISWSHAVMESGGEPKIRANVDFMFNRRGGEEIFGRFRKEA